MKALGEATLLEEIEAAKDREVDISRAQLRVGSMKLELVARRIISASVASISLPVVCDPYMGDDEWAIVDPEALEV
jgi:hypothetical protein